MTGTQDLRERLGPVGAVLGYNGWDGAADAAPELEALGCSTLWLCGNPFDLARVPEILRATRAATVSTAVIAADQFDADVVGRTYAAAQSEHPGRFVAGLGGAHGPRPLHTLREYLDRLDDGPHPIPAGSRLLSALGPKMLDLAAERTAGAVPVLASTEYAAQARARLGPGAVLVVEQFVSLDADPTRARDVARSSVGFQRDIEGGYGRHFTRMGFSDDDVATLSDRLVEAVVACGDSERVVKRIAEHQAAGADHVALMVVPPERGAPVMPQWRLLADALSTRS